MQYDNLTDEQIMILYQNGDAGAFKVLYDKHASKVYGFLRKRISNQERAAEIFQEVFVKLHKSKKSYSENYSALAWIFTVTRTVMIDELRKEKRVQLVDGYDFDQIPAKSEAAESYLDNEILKKLPDQQKAAIELRYFGEKTFEEIAEVLNVSPGNSRKIISRGIKRLSELIAAGGKDEK